MDGLELALSLSRERDRLDGWDRLVEIVDTEVDDAEVDRLRASDGRRTCSSSVCCLLLSSSFLAS